MKISFIDDNIIIYINNQNIDLNNIEYSTDYFKKLILKIKEKYEIDIEGFYFVKIYKDLYSGIVIEINKSDMDYYDYYIDEVDMHITVIETSFLYKINDYFINDKILINSKLINYKNYIYLFLDKEIDLLTLSYLHENSELLYKDTSNIIKYGKIVKYKDI